MTAGSITALLRRPAPLTALTGGLLVALSMPPWGWWPLAFVGIAVFAVTVRDEASARRRALLGFAFGAGWMYPAMAWMWFLTVPGYFIACALFAGYHAIAAAVVRPGDRAVIARPAAHALAETVRLLFPFGGVPLATLGISQADGPLLRVASLGGIVLIGWLVFQIGFSIAELLLVRRSTDSPRPPLTGLGVSAIVFVVAVVTTAIVPGSHEIEAAPMTVAAVQGGGEQGTRALDVPSRLVTERHLEATRTIEPDPDLDLVLWPENAIDVNREPFLASEQYALIAAEAARLGVPFSVGLTIDSEYSRHPVDDSFVNAQVVIEPSGDVTSWYEKVHIVPFGEYVPFRGLLSALGAPLENVASDATRGQDPAILDVSGTPVGVMISWEVFFGSRARAAQDGAFLINPTNGSSYTWSILQTQQIASSKLRAMETGRWVVQASPTGFSAFVTPTGDVIDRTAVGEQSVIRHDVPLREGRTLYGRLGDLPWIIALLLVLVVALGPRRRERTPSAASADPHRAGGRHPGDGQTGHEQTDDEQSDLSDQPSGTVRSRATRRPG